MSGRGKSREDRLKAELRRVQGGTAPFKMTNAKCLMTKEVQNPNDEDIFGLRH